MNMRSLLVDFSVLRPLVSLGGLLLTGLFACALSVKPLSASTPFTTSTLANYHCQNGQCHVALDEAGNELEARPNEPPALALQGQACERLKAFALATSGFFCTEPGSGQELEFDHNQGLLLCQQCHDPTAFEHSGLAVQLTLYADKVRTFWICGVCAEKSGDETAELSLWTQSLALNSSSESALTLVKSEQQQKPILRAIDSATAVILWSNVQWINKLTDSHAVKLSALVLQKSVSYLVPMGRFHARGLR